MTAHAVPDIANSLIDAYVWLDPKIGTYGPGVVFVAVFAVAWRALNRASAYIERCRYRVALGRVLADERQQMADLSAALDNAPLIPTQPGHDGANLDTCHAIWDADTRKETDQP